MFKIGDKVTVIDPTKAYTCSERITEMLGLTAWHRGYAPSSHSEHTIISRTFAQYSSVVVYGVQSKDTGMQYVVPEKGLASVPVLREFRLVYDIVTKERCTAVVISTTSDEARDTFDKKTEDYVLGKMELVSIEAVHNV